MTHKQVATLSTMSLCENKGFGGVGLASFVEDVAAGIRASIRQPVWVRCEVTRITPPRPAGQMYLEVCEADERDGKARAKVVVWKERAADIFGRFSLETGTELSEGMRVLIQVTPRLNACWGFQLNALDIDPVWTVGSSRLAADAIRQRLSDEGIFDRNCDLPRPQDFTSVAVIAPDGSAGLADFLASAGPAADLGLCRIDVTRVPFEGVGASSAVAGALSAASKQASSLDAVFIVRGGGPSAALSWLNSEDVVRAACLCPVPIITGIGHEGDRVLLDEVACMSFGTPSKAALHLISIIVEGARQASDAWDDIRSEAGGMVAAVKNSIDALIREAVGFGPSATLDRGYAVILAGGMIVNSAAEVAKHSHLTARFRDGNICLNRDDSETVKTREA
jgi:exodeoxyribonuclease VII large subunit